MDLQAEIRNECELGRPRELNLRCDSLQQSFDSTRNMLLNAERSVAQLRDRVCITNKQTTSSNLIHREGEDCKLLAVPYTQGCRIC